METIFTIAPTDKAVTNPAFHGTSYPIQDPENLQDAVAKLGEQSAYVLMIRAYRLDRQKFIKALAAKEGATVEQVRAEQAKYDERVKAEPLTLRDPNAPKKVASGVVNAVRDTASAATDSMDTAIEALRAAGLTAQADELAAKRDALREKLSALSASRKKSDETPAQSNGAAPVSETPAAVAEAPATEEKPAASAQRRTAGAGRK